MKQSGLSIQCEKEVAGCEIFTDFMYVTNLRLTVMLGAILLATLASSACSRLCPVSTHSLDDNAQL